MKIYFDTEFEGLFSNAGSISIGLTTEDGKAIFYEELENTYKIDNCSLFCKNVVLPLLSNQKKITLEELNIKLKNWIESFNTKVYLVCDNEKDIQQINKIFPEGLPFNCNYIVLNYWQKINRKIKNRNRKVYKQYNLRDHHSLDDAIVNRIIFEGK